MLTPFVLCSLLCYYKNIMGATYAGKTGSLLHVLSFPRIVFSSGGVLDPPQQQQQEESHTNDNGCIAPGSDVQVNLNYILILCTLA